MLLRHPGDLAAQLRHTLDNLGTVLVRGNDQTTEPDGSGE